ncbi:MAG: hypothetical protein MUE85_24560 [Microscillaceae bacterium]|jgi:hypothetical protein|nr:hypothetical protein [Microscillaceae bacterium]
MINRINHHNKFKYLFYNILAIFLISSNCKPPIVNTITCNIDNKEVIFSASADYMCPFLHLKEKYVPKSGSCELSIYGKNKKYSFYIHIYRIPNKQLEGKYPIYRLESNNITNKDIPIKDVFKNHSLITTDSLFKKKNSTKIYCHIELIDEETGDFFASNDLGEVEITHWDKKKKIIIGIFDVIVYDKKNNQRFIKNGIINNVNCVER